MLTLDLPLQPARPHPFFPGAPEQGQPPLPPGSSFQQLCDLLRIADQVDYGATSNVRFEHMPVRAGQRVHLIGQACDCLYVVRGGMLKTTLPPRHGREQIMQFPMRGDLLGADGMDSGRYTMEAMALAPGELVVLPLAVLSTLGRQHQGLVAAMCGVMARGLARDQLLIGARAGLGTHARMARFLLYIAQRQAECGYSGGNVALRMQRGDIANYLGMAPETVSRTMAALEERGLVALGRDNVWIRDPEALRKLRRMPRCTD